MARMVFRFVRPERFIAGTVGMPGERSFYLQVRDGRRVVSVLLEKQQVAMLAQRLLSLLDDIARAEKDVEIPGYVPAEFDDRNPLDTPISEEFRVGAIGLGWDATAQLVIVEAHAQTDDDAEPVSGDDESADAPDVLSVRILPGYARAFAARAELLVSAGRPPCPLCTLPLDPQGHICPRANGYRR